MQFGSTSTIEPAPIYPRQFERRERYNKDGTVKDAKDWVTFVKKGTGIPNATTVQVDRIKNDAPIWAAIEPYYEAWKKGKEAAADGTPLDVWPGVVASEIDTLQKHNIFSVEDFAQVTDSDCQRLKFPGARAKRDKAREFMGNKNAVEEVSALQRRIAELEAEKEAKAEPQKRGPGRPRKDEVASGHSA